MPSISIIVPMFNASKYVSACIDSILVQTYDDYELLLIDDGSTDDTSCICQKYQSDPRIHYYSKKNGGVSSARNVGIDHARGEYILFVDSDDKLPENAIENHLNRFTDDVDMTMGAFMAFSENGREKYRVDVKESNIVSADRCLFDFTPNGREDWQRYLWNRMMRMSIIKENNLRFNEKIAYKEDGLFLVQYLLKCKGNVAYFPDIVYCYRQNPSSAMGALKSGHTEKLVTNIDAHALIIKELRKSHVDKGILAGEIAHAFSSRNWVLDILKRNERYNKRIWASTLFKLLNALGIHAIPTCINILKQKWIFRRS